MTNDEQKTEAGSWRRPLALTSLVGNHVIRFLDCLFHSVFRISSFIRHSSFVIRHFGVVVLVGVAAASSQALPRWEIDPAGLYASDPRMPALVAVASEARDRALARLRKEWKLSPGSTPIHWRWDTAAVPSGPSPAKVGPSRSGAQPDFEFGRTYIEDGVVNVLLPARKFLARPRTVAAVVLHECLHAVHASHTSTRERYEATPRWLREGVALVFSGEGEERVRERIAYTAYGGADARSFVRGVDTVDVSRAEAYLAVARLEAMLGRERFVSLVRKIVTGENAVRAVTDFCGMSLSSLGEHLRRAARATIRDLLPRHREERFRELLKRLRAEPGTVTAKLEILLAEKRDGPLAGTVRYLLAREALREAQRAPAEARALPTAIAHLEALRRDPGTLWRPEALVLLGQCYLKDGRRAAARRAWREVTEMFGEDRAVAEPARRLLAATPP